MGPSAPHNRWARFSCVAAVLAATTWTIVYHTTWSETAPSTVFLVYLVATGVMLFTFTAAATGRRFTSLPPAPGRVVAIVPAYNEDPELLEQNVRALIGQSRPPDAIHVVDDGSVVPVVPFDHPLVTWHRQANQGKRRAQAAVLRRLDPADVDFVLTVDSDSVLDREALEHLLRSMSDPRVQAATGLMMVHNRAAKLMTRVIDLEIVTWCLVTRTARSLLGAVAPTSGVLAIYRSELVFDNLDDYVASGTAGDDRRLTHYALGRGQVVAVNEATVHSHMPERLGELFRQRTRWFKSYWRYVLWELEHFSAVPLLFRLYGLLFLAVSPIVYGWLLATVAEQATPVLVQGFGYWVIMTWAQTGMYAAMRPELDVRTRVTTWLFLTPLVSLMGLFVIKPAMYWAVFRTRDRSWQTRTVPAVPAARPR